MAASERTNPHHARRLGTPWWARLCRCQTPAVRESTLRRTFTAAYKFRIVEEAVAAIERGTVDALLRREGP